jgi:capsular exopolysaccharide synthesis family protein
MNIATTNIGANYVASVTAGEPAGVDGTAPGVLEQYLRIAKRWRWVILGVTLAAFVIGFLVTMLMTPQYTATATIEISRDGDQVTNFEGVSREVSVADQEFYQTQYGLLRSRSLAERVAAQLRLTDDPAFFGAFGRDDADDKAFQRTGQRYVASGRAVRQRIAGEILLDNLSINPTRLSRLVDIHFSSPDPALSAKVANAWAEMFIDSNLQRKVQATAYGRRFLQEQLGEYKDRLDRSQKQLVAYASAQQIINLPAQAGGDGTVTQERSIVADDLASLNLALNTAIADRIQAEARFRRSGAAGSSTEALSNSAINNLRQRRAELAAEYQQLMVRFEPAYPAAQALQTQIEQLDRSIAREEGRVLGGLRAQYEQALSRENALEERVNGLKGQYLDLRRRSIQYNIYQQEVDTNRALYDGLLQRFKEIGVTAGIGVNNIAVVDRADIPEEPSSPRFLLNLIISIFAGLMLGVAVAFGLEQLDEAISDPHEVEKKLGLALLGSVPHLDADQPPIEALIDRKSDLNDAYIAIITNLSFSTEHGVPRSFSVTSTRPAEGKSTSALALATTLARSGKKTILVDGDMRSPSVHELGGVDHSRGLSNYLSGEEDLDSLVFQMDKLGLTAMTAGPLPPNAAELLTGARFANLINVLLQSYDHVVVDSPPVLGLADAPLIASSVEGVVYAVESHGIRAAAVKMAMTRLMSANARIFGAVLTKFEPNRSSYGYGYDYGYGYGREKPA